MPTSQGDDKLSALLDKVGGMSEQLAAQADHRHANQQQVNAAFMASLGEIKGTLQSGPSAKVDPMGAWVKVFLIILSVIAGVGALGGSVFALGQAWASADSRQAATDTKISQVEAEMRMRLDTARMEMQQADAIMRQQQQAAGDQIRLLHTTDQAANERMAQVYQSLATITVQNQNLAERMSELGRRQDRLEARLGLSRDQRNAQPSGLGDGL